MTRIVTTAYRYRRSPKKRKAVAIAGPAVVRKAKVVRLPSGGKAKPEPAAPPPPANDDRIPPPGARKPAIVTTTSRKRTKLLRAEQAAEPDDDPEADAAMRHGSNARNGALGQHDEQDAHALAAQDFRRPRRARGEALA